MTTASAFPDTPEALAEFIKDDDRATEVWADPKARAKFLNEYAKTFNKVDQGQIVSELRDQMNASMLELAKDMGLKKDQGPDLTELKPKALKGMRGTGAVRNAQHNATAIAAQLDGQYDGFGDLVLDIKNIATAGPQTERQRKLYSVRNAYSSFDPASAGFLIPEEFRSELMQLALEESVIRPRATVITMGTQRVSLPFVDETTHVGSVKGGMIFYWTQEAATIAVTEAKFGRVTLEAKKLTGGARVPNELMADAPALTSFLNTAAPSGLAFYEDDAFINGDGGMQPLGILNAPAAVSVSKETSQVAATLVYDNIVKMYSRMLPASLSRAVWLVNQAVLPQLLTMSAAVGTGGALVFQQTANEAPNMTLFGRPIVVTEKLPTLGTVGDIVFADLSYYLIGDRQSVSVESSEHSRFMSDETEIRIIERVDGRPWIQSALTPKAGSTLSPFVTLATRA